MHALFGGDFGEKSAESAKKCIGLGVVITVGLGVPLGWEFLVRHVGGLSLLIKFQLVLL